MTWLQSLRTWGPVAIEVGLGVARAVKRRREGYEVSAEEVGAALVVAAHKIDLARERVRGRR